RSLTPTSIGCPSVTAGFAGVAAGNQMVQGQPLAEMRWAWVIAKTRQSAATAETTRRIEWAITVSTPSGLLEGGSKTVTGVRSWRKGATAIKSLITRSRQLLITIE